MTEKRVLVSACLLGMPCRYDGRAKPCEAVLRLAAAGAELVPVCPEQLGGLPTPRTSAEIQPDGRYWMDEDGFGMEDDEEIWLCADIDEEGRFITPFH